MILTWDRKLLILNIVCQSVFVVYTSLSLFIGLRITLPDVYNEDAETLFNRKILAVTLVLYTFGNYVCIKLKAPHSVFTSQQSALTKGDIVSYDSNKVKGSGTADAYLQLNATPPSAFNLAGWYKCRHCNVLSPPRSKHCPICQSCILKRDHHCFFAGCCIGFHNQRYFAVFCFYGSMGAFYCALVVHYYLEKNDGLFQHWGLIAYFPPFLLGALVMGYTSSKSVLFVLLSLWSFFTASLCLYFFLLQSFLVLRGQTKYELKNRDFSFRSSFSHNVMSVFGPSKFLFIVGFLIPSPFLGYFGDGKSWDELGGHGTKVA